MEYELESTDGSAFEDSTSPQHLKDFHAPLFPDFEPSYMASPYPSTGLDDPAEFVGSLGEDGATTTTCSSLINLEPDSAHLIMPTPPPESTGSTPKHRSSPTEALSPNPRLSSSTSSNSVSEYIKGSSLEESPVSSPSSCLGNGFPAAGQNVIVNNHNKTKNGLCIKEEGSRLPEIDQHGSSISERAATGQLGSVSSDEDKDEGHCSTEALEMDGEGEGEGDEESTTGSPQDQSIPKNVKLPQRKGGMQLWQFLYALLSDSEKKYGKLIEWTANNRSREFRLLEPEAIAIWWGEHKNKKNMSYDKLSRSLRYYYDKGIIRKIPGERYVYQFCIDPELMYKHIGNSDCRPKLKPMPQAAQHATSDYQMKHGYTSVLPKDPLYIAQGPVSLAMLGGRGPVTYGLHHDMFLPPSYSALPTFTQSNYYDSTYMPHGLDMSVPPTTAHAGVGYPLDSCKPHVPPMRKCRSFDSPSMYSSEAEVPYTPSYMSGPSLASSMPSVIHTPPPGSLPPPHDLSPPPASSGGASPIAPSFSGRSELLDELIELTSADSFTTQHPTVYSTCDGNVPMFSNSDNMAAMWSFQ